MYGAYLACRRNKRNKLSALAFEVNFEENLICLVEELREMRYRPATSICFYTRKPKAREIFAADFRDRIVHHLVYQAIAPKWERIFIHHSYACRPQKGTHRAANALQGFLRKITQNGSRRAFYLKMDIKNFFMSVDRLRLFEILVKHHRNRSLLWLLSQIIFHDPTKDFELQDRGRLRRYLPPHKSLFNAPPNCGLPIGNLTSQFFANVYLNALDQFVKHGLKCQYYLRYVDDFVLLDTEAERLREWHSEISNFVADNLALQINERAVRLAPVAGGVDFAGFIIRQNYKLVRRRVVGNLKESLRELRTKLVRRTGDDVVYHFHRETLSSCEASINSYLGHFRHAATRRCLQQIWKEFSFLNIFFVLSSDKVVRIDNALLRKNTFSLQVNWLLQNFEGYVCLIEVGCYFEAYQNQARKLAAAVQLHLLSNWRGFGVGCGFPTSRLKQIVFELRQQRIPVVIVKQTGRERYTARQRSIDLIVEFSEK